MLNKLLLENHISIPTLPWLLLLVYSSTAYTEEFTHYSINMALHPQQSTLEVTSEIRLPMTVAGNRTVKFLLHGDLQLDSSQLDIRKQVDVLPEFKKIIENAEVPLTQYIVELKDKEPLLKLKYRGRIYHKLDENQNGSPGLISKDGVFLARSSAWFPLFGDTKYETGLLSFDLSIQVPRDWSVVSQGELIKNQTQGKIRSIRWVESKPQDDIYVVASRYKEYQQSVNGINAMVFLRGEDEALAKKYMKATGKYVAMYDDLIGPYPYAKFALVENFWETGYGMPSFTLLGSRVIRLPFIIYSSYPHEILHNYWGNGVFVDYQTGNWSEGLTAYLADHLFKEQRGEGAEYRRNVLQKYSDFVNEGRDFPLVKFRSRHDSATEAVGYGKTLMLFHMLRLRMGDDKFIDAIQRLYGNFKFKVTSFTDIEKTFSIVAKKNLSPVFKQWVKEAGAPQLKIGMVKTNLLSNGYQLNMTIKQVQKARSYQLNIPVVVYFAGGQQPLVTILKQFQKDQVFSIKLPDKPSAVDVDPWFDVFRRLDSKEIPAAISQGFGDEKPLLVLPENEKPARLAAYKKLAEQWRKRYSSQLEIVSDKLINELPANRSIWLLGWNNKFRNKLANKLKDQKLNVAKNGFTLHGKFFDKENHAILVAVRQPENPDKTLLWLSSENTGAIPGLSRKLPHYRKYSYLVFKGSSPDNIVKGQWEVRDSPMRIVLDEKVFSDQQKPAPRPALIMSGKKH